MLKVSEKDIFKIGPSNAVFMAKLRELARPYEVDGKVHYIIEMRPIRIARYFPYYTYYTVRNKLRALCDFGEINSIREFEGSPFIGFEIINYNVD